MRLLRPDKKTAGTWLVRCLRLQIWTDWNRASIKRERQRYFSPEQLVNAEDDQRGGGDFKHQNGRHSHLTPDRPVPVSGI
jgi:hypothetical protein